VSNSKDEYFIVDDDQRACAAFSNLFVNAGYLATAFTDEKLFVRTRRYEYSLCRPAGVSSLDILTKLDARECPAPALILSGRGAIPSAVEAVRNGAGDLIETRLGVGTILDRVRTAIGRCERRRQNDDLPDGSLPSLPGYDLLKSRERQVLFQITSAASIKETRRGLGISPRAVAVRRRHIMQNLSVRRQSHARRVEQSAYRLSITPISDEGPAMVASSRFAQFHKYLLV
jgi:two-component system, LuxR family, response regulator FixJ